jgi:chitinase
MTTINQIKTGIMATSRHTHASMVLPKHILVGYWHNWQAEAASFIQLRNIPSKFDVINVAFAGCSGKDIGLMTFTPCEATTVEQFKADIAYLHKLGKKVLISVGGANGSVAIADASAQQNFAESVTAIIREYGFDGIDVNLERKVTLDLNDTDFKNPTSPSVTNLIAAIKKIRANFGADFIISMAPETICVQGGYKAYGGIWGSYLPVIYALGDILTYVHVQHYNSGLMTALDGKAYVQGTADFHVAMAEMLLQGFPINGNTDNLFPTLKPEQIAIGLPALANAANDGYTAPLEVQKALNYLTKGKPFGGKYTLRLPSGYPTLRGLMTWSINWDAASYHQFSQATRSYLDALP